jgi:4-amino-4-deoxy-L-arabinose transferase-like glycosyltransferase/tetratricopeptide (TPR) repeat protein
MKTKSPPASRKKSWISAHPRVVIGIILVACLGPFLNKAIHMDDPLFVWTGEWIQKHPADFFGFKVNWWKSTIPMWAANWNPPMMSYFLAGVASLFGWNEIALHLACLGVAFLAATGIYSLAQRWCERPLLATLVAIFMPAFLVSSSTLMCDVAMLAFWVWALVLWERALVNGQGRWQFVAAGVLAGLAVLTKYSAVTLLPLLPILGVLRTRKLGWWLAGLVVPLLMVAGYEWLTGRMYGTGLFSAAVGHTQHSRGFPSGWEDRGIIGLAFAGGCLLPLLFFAPWLWRPRTLLAGGFVILGILSGIFWLGGNLGLLYGNSGLMKHWGFATQVLLLTAGGLHLLLLTAAEVWPRRNLISVTLALWILGGLFSAIVLNFTINARGFLLVVPAAAILLVRRLEAAAVAGKVRLLGPLIPAAAITMSLVMADCQMANSARAAAKQIAMDYRPANHQLWFEGHGAFQYYMEKLGGQPLDVERSLLLPGDVVVVPWISYSFVTFPPDSVGWIVGVQYRSSSRMNLFGGTERGAAGFYGAAYGPVPFALGGFPSQEYYVLKVFPPLQWNSQPTDRQKLRPGDLPSFPQISCVPSERMTFQWQPESLAQVRLARQYEADGKLEAAIQCYRKAVEMDSNNPAALNTLAWMLATTGKPDLRQGQEAVELATKAVELTDARLPAFLETLAAANAAAGHFSDAREAANVAYTLGRLTNQKKQVVPNAGPSARDFPGPALDATNAPWPR